MITDKQRNYLRSKAILEQNKKRILRICPEITENSGIYVFQRTENEIVYAYVGQAVNLLARTAQHLSGYQHIDLSLKKRGLYDSEKNPTGWALTVMECDKDKLDEQEQRFIQEWAKFAQLYNHTTGGQGEGKSVLGEAKSPKGYRDGIEQGRKTIIKEIALLFDLHLKAVYKANKPSKNAEKAMNKFMDLIQGDNEE